MNITVAKADELSLEDQITLYIDAMANVYGQSASRMRAVANCESAYKQDAERAITVYGDKGKAYSLWQFHKQTFLKWEKESGMDLDYGSWRDQTKLAGWAWSQGRSYRDDWTCYRNLYL